MGEKGLPEQVIMAQVGHVSREMLSHYTHVGRLALNQAAAALEPDYPSAQTAQAEMVN